VVLRVRRGTTRRTPGGPRRRRRRGSPRTGCTMNLWARTARPGSTGGRCWRRSAWAWHRLACPARRLGPSCSRPSSGRPPRQPEAHDQARQEQGPGERPLAEDVPSSFSPPGATAARPCRSAPA
jgi:hypothetical protein